MRFSLVNVGCKVNRVEIDGIAARLLEGGAQLAEPGQADIVVVNTCTVTGEAEKKTRKAVRHALRNNPRAQLLVTGCAAAINPDEFASIDARVHVLGKAQVVPAAWELVGDAAHGVHPDDEAAPAETPAGASAGASEPGHRAAPGNGGAGNRQTAGCPKAAPASAAATVASAGLRMGGAFRTRVGIKVQDGCNNACTFCIVHVARGLPASVPADQVEREVRRYADAGVRELVLTGINLGTYASDGLGLAGLVRRLLPLVPEGRLRISSVEPLDVSDDLIELLAESDGRVCRHLHLPLQSGSSKVLAEMARPYDADWFANRVAAMRRAVPQLSLSTDIIVGFPGETEADFRQTCDLAREVGFSKIHVFRYSRRAGTPAAVRSDQVPPQVIADRAHRLAELGRRLAFEDAARRAGTTERVLVERTGRGTTESYHTAVVPEGYEPGSLVALPLTEPAADGIFHL